VTTPPPRTVVIRDGSIRLGQFLKLANVIASGADAKMLLAEGEVTVNEVPEARRGRQLQKGDRVHLPGIELVVG
jgi:ribosome-associated protein